MKGIRIWTLCILCLIVVEGENKLLQCYVCDDCDVFNDCLLQTCPHGSVVPPTVPSTTGSQATPTSPIPTTTPTTLRTTVRPGSTTPITPTTPGVLTSVTPSTSPIPTISTTATAITTEHAPSTETEETSDSTTLSYTEATTPSTQGTTQLRLIRNIRHASLDTSVSHHCYTIDVIEHYKQKTKRGCVEVLEEQSACGVLRKVYGCSAKNCKVCSTDGCNCNGALRSSLFAVAVIMACGMFSKMI